MTTITTIAGIAGRIAGTTARGLIWAYRTIDWAEVAQIVIEGLQVLIVLTLLAGRYSRRAWDQLPVLSERLGRWYAALLVPAAAPTTTPVAAPMAPIEHPLAVLATELEQLSRRELQALAGCRRKVAKGQLIAMALAY